MGVEIRDQFEARTVGEIKQDILALSKDEYADLRRWIFDADWEREFDADVRAGKLDALAADALEAKAGGELKDL